MFRISSQSQTTQFIKDTRTDYRIDLFLGTRNHLNQVEPDDTAARIGDALQQVNNLLKRKSSRDRRSRMHTMLQGQTIDIEADINHLWKFFHNAPTTFGPSPSFKGSSGK